MILIIDYGSQFNQLIAKCIRNFKVRCQIEPNNINIEKIKEISPKGIIFSGGPRSIYETKNQKINKDIFKLKIPILGICYGMHIIAHSFGGKIKKSLRGEYGYAKMFFKFKSEIFNGIEENTKVWMSHKDSIMKLPNNFIINGFTENTKIAAFSNSEKKIYGIQFHPEVKHSLDGEKIIKNFIFNICNCNKDWHIKSFLDETIKITRKIVKKHKVVLGLSGGIDSLLTAVILEKSIGNKLTSIFIDNGLLRKNESKEIKKQIRKILKSEIKFTNYKYDFINKLNGIINPERKRKIIGNLFIKIFDYEASKIKNVKFLAQGTLYPDVIESHSAFGGPSSTIKSHHNVGGLPKKMKLKLIEPLKYLFKDEVRSMALKLGIDKKMINRQPFPGPGLAIRIVGKITPKKILLLRKIDKVLQEEIKKYGWYEKLWQSFAILFPIKSVGIMGDKRTYNNIAGIRAVTSSDAMTADWAKIPYDLLGKISNRIINEIDGINRVMYDISSKPPSTIEIE